MITLASKRYTLLAYGTTLDSRYPEGGTPMSVVVFENFDAYTLPGAWGITAQYGASVTLETTGAYGGSGKSLKGSYPAGVNSVACYGGYNLSALSTRHFYMRFRAKMPNGTHGFKFVKVFGKQNDPTGYADVTFGIDYASGTMTGVSFGDGSGTANDTQQVLRFDGTTAYLGRNLGVATIASPVGNFTAAEWGSGWHLFEFYWKFNSGTSAETEVNDGACIVKIDGVTYMDATGLYNRHYSNGPIYSIEILNYTTGNTDGFDIWYDNIEISQNGWGNSAV